MLYKILNLHTFQNVLLYMYMYFILFLIFFIIYIMLLIY